MRTAVYVGRGEAYRFVHGGWERQHSYDYDFSVVQRFHEDGWESVKEIYRRHPDYLTAGRVTVTRRFTSG